MATYTHLIPCLPRDWRAVLGAALVGCLIFHGAVATAQPPAAPPTAGGDLPLPSPAVLARESDLIDEVIEPELVLKLNPIRSKIVRTKLPVSRMAITDPAIMSVTQFSPKEFELVGGETGETTFTVWYVNDDGSESLIRYLVRVVPEMKNKIEQERAETEYGELQDRLNELFPNSAVQLIPVIDKLIVKGQARDSQEASEIMAIISGEVVDQGGSLRFDFGRSTVAKIPGAEDLPSATVVNMLTVPGEQQIMLKVRVAEISRTALREFGAEINYQDSMEWMVDYITGVSGNISAILDSGDVELFVKAFAGNGYGKILAEPTLVTLNGYPATFLAGGEFAVPTAVGIDGIGAATTTFRGFGTQLSFIPTIIDKDRLRLQVTPSFSSLNGGNAVNGIPGLNTRAVSTTVDLREGQWLAIAGLIQDEQEGERSRIPYIGDIPVLGAVFGRQHVSRAETELVVLVSPELVHPLEVEQVPLLLPGMDVTEPTDHEFFWLQRIEGRPNFHHRSTMWPRQRELLRDAKHQAVREAKRQAKLNAGFRDHQKHYISGPHGFSK